MYYLKKFGLTIINFVLAFLLTLIVPITYFFIQGQAHIKKIPAGTMFFKISEELGSPESINFDCKTSKIIVSYKYGNAFVGHNYLRLILTNDGQVVSSSHIVLSD